MQPQPPGVPGRAWSRPDTDIRIRRHRAGGGPRKGLSLIHIWHTHAEDDADDGHHAEAQAALAARRREYEAGELPAEAGEHDPADDHAGGGRGVGHGQDAEPGLTDDFV